MPRPALCVFITLQRLYAVLNTHPDIMVQAAVRDEPKHKVFSRDVCYEQRF